MANDAEYREFFERNVQVTTGSKSDQEVGFPVSYLINGISRFNRFLKNNFPSQNVFIKLFKSLPFKLNIEDTSTTTTQGLTRLSTNAEAIARTNTSNPTAFANTVQPFDLPDILADGTVGGSSIISTVQNNSMLVDSVTTTVSGATKRNYSVRLFRDVAAPGPAMAYGTDQTGARNWVNIIPQFGIVILQNTHSIPTGFVTCNGSAGTPNINGSAPVGCIYIMKS